jgi:RNA polymerase sigma factor for flagellar operon FliA
MQTSVKEHDTVPVALLTSSGDGTSRGATAAGDAWERYKKLRDPAARDEIILKYAYLVNITVGRVVINLPPNMDREDLVSAGIIGLIKAVDQFDVNRQVKFETYGIALIRGAILEMLRDQDWVPRSVRDRVKAIDRAMAARETLLGRPPTDAEIAAELGIDVDVYHRLLGEVGRTGLVSLDDIVLGSDEGEGVTLREALPDDRNNTLRAVEIAERARRLAQAVDRLPPRERHVISLYYVDRLTFKEIGRVLGISESRAYQLHGQAVARLRKDLKVDEPLFRM